MERCFDTLVLLAYFHAHLLSVSKARPHEQHLGNFLFKLNFLPAIDAFNNSIESLTSIHVVSWPVEGYVIVIFRKKDVIKNEWKNECFEYSFPCAKRWMHYHLLARKRTEFKIFVELTTPNVGRKFLYKIPYELARVVATWCICSIINHSYCSTFSDYSFHLNLFN